MAKDHLDPSTIDRNADILAHIAGLVNSGALEEASAYAAEHYPFAPIPTRRSLAKEMGLPPRVRGGTPRARRPTLTPERRNWIWERDRYEDRYLGSRLIHPAALELLAILLPAHFPYDNPPHGRYQTTHRCMWELWPAIDHVVPLAGATREAVHGDDNLVTTSALVNQLKADYDLASLGWRLLPVSAANQGWDGLSGWFLRYVDGHPEFMVTSAGGQRLRTWAGILRRSLPSTAK